MPRVADGDKTETNEAETRETAGLGLTAEEGRSFARLAENGGRGGQAAMLRAKRRALLDEIHERQRIIDNIDCLIWRWQRDEGGNKR